MRSTLFAAAAILAAALATSAGAETKTLNFKVQVQTLSDDNGPPVAVSIPEFAETWTWDATSTVTTGPISAGKYTRRLEVLGDMAVSTTALSAEIAALTGADASASRPFDTNFMSLNQTYLAADDSFVESSGISQLTITGNANTLFSLGGNNEEGDANDIFLIGSHTRILVLGSFGNTSFEDPGFGASTLETWYSALGPLGWIDTYTVTFADDFGRNILSTETHTYRGIATLQAGGAVPEPTTWALLIGGFGMTGAMLRRRRMAGATPAAL